MACAAQGSQAVAPMANKYSKGDTLPFQSRPTARRNTEEWPSALMIDCWSSQYATAAINKTAPYSADGIEAKWFSPIQPVAKGKSESQKRKCKFAQSTAPETFVEAWSM